MDATPLFKGATRPAVKFGVPIKPLVGAFLVVASLAMLFGLALWALAPLVWGAMALITRRDPRAFRQWWLWISTRGIRPHGAFWGGSSVSPVDHRARP